jgi:hypothetical protein
MSAPIHLALISESEKISGSDLAAVTGAIQKQLARDFAPHWDVTATLTAFPTLEETPADYWPVIVRDDLGIPPLGLHLLEDDQPYALIRYTDTWSLSVSHEVLELCLDPTGDRLVTGPPIAGDNPVEYLIEVCDPSEAKEFAYSIDGILVSDFYLPSFFDAEPMPGTRYSFSGSITQPRDVLSGGYISWRDPATDAWYQWRRFGDDQGIHPLGQLDPTEASLRTQIDERTPHPELEDGVAPDAREYLRATEARQRVLERAAERAQELRQAIAELLTTKGGSA